MRRTLLAVAAIAAFATSAAAQPKMLVRQPSSYLGYGYGNYSWNAFTSIFNNAFGGASNITVTSGLSSGALAGYNALMLSLPTLPDSPWLLSASEVAEVSSFLNAGGRMYVFGENNAWQNWDNQIASIVGATVGSSCFYGNTNAVGTSGLLNGVNSIYAPCANEFTSLGGGTKLFANDVAALFGPTQNALVYLDVNICDDSYIGTADNRQFCSNIGGWLSGEIDPPTTVPEPGTWVLMATGLAGVLTIKRRRRNG